MVTDPELFPYSTPALLEDIALCKEENVRTESAYLLRDSKCMHEQLYPNAARFPVMRRQVELHGFHNRLVDEMSRAEIDTQVKFPPPPLKGTDAIIPITTARELVEEGRLQHHCVGSYITQVAWYKKIYVYRIVHPERATLAVIRRRGAWRIHELRLACNETPSLETYHAVMGWLECQSRDLAI
jgi:hypothetical protein